MTDNGPTERELDVLKVLWELGESRVRDVHEAMCRSEVCAFTTVQTLLRIMAEKGLVNQRNADRTLFYTPVFTREQVSSRFLKSVFDGALSRLVLNMLQSEKVPADQLQELERLVTKARRDKQKED